MTDSPEAAAIGRAVRTLMALSLRIHQQLVADWPVPDDQLTDAEILSRTEALTPAITERLLELARLGDADALAIDRLAAIDDLLARDELRAEVLDEKTFELRATGDPEALDHIIDHRAAEIRAMREEF